MATHTNGNLENYHRSYLSYVKAVFDQAVDSAAWQSIPSWYIVSQEDHAINPELERFMAKRIGAKTTEIKSSHLSYISHPKEVANLIIKVASSAVK